MRRIIEDRLLELGVTPNLAGFDCICDSVEILLEEPKIKFTTLYAIVGKKNSCKPMATERRIRHALSYVDNFAWNEMGGSGTKNSEFLCTLALLIGREMESKEKKGGCKNESRSSSYPVRSVR